MTKQWDEVWSDIRDLYVRQGKTLPEVMTVMRSRGFHASTRSYREKFREWGFKRGKNRGKPPVRGCEENDDEHSPSSATSDPRRTETESELIAALNARESEDRRQTSDLITSYHQTPLQSHHAELFRQVLGSKVYLPAESMDGLTYLHLAAAYSSAEKLKSVTALVENVDVRVSEHSLTPLFVAVIWNRPHIVDALLGAGSDPTLTITGGISCLHIAAADLSISFGSSIIQMLASEGGDPNVLSTSEFFSNTPLSACLTATQICPRPKRPSLIQRAKALLEHGADILVTDANLLTPFQSFTSPWSSCNFWYREVQPLEEDCLALFVSKGACVDDNFISKSCGQGAETTLLHEILFHTPGTRLSLKLIENADCSPQGNGWNILHTLVKPCPSRQSSPSDPTLADLIKKTMERGAEANELSLQRYTPLTSLLTYVPDSDVPSCLDALLRGDNGANPMLRDERNQNPLFQVFGQFESPLKLGLAEKLLTATKAHHITDESEEWTKHIFPITEEHWNYRPGQQYKFLHHVQPLLPPDVGYQVIRAVISISIKMFLMRELRTPPDETKYLNIRRALWAMEYHHLPEYALPRQWVMELLDAQHSSARRATMSWHEGQQS